MGEHDMYTLWPKPDAPGRYEAGCCCGVTVKGTAAEINAWSRRHDDAPWRSHIVTIMHGGKRIDGDAG